MDLWTRLKICFFFNIWVSWPHVFAQEGFVSLSCGGLSNFTDSIGITWTTDDGYISTGKKGNIPSAGNQTLRYFPSGSKNCYTFDALRGKSYLLRGTFAYLNYDNTNRPPVLDIAVDTVVVSSVQTTGSDTHVVEVIITAQGRISYCLISRIGIPIISSLELRLLPDSSYPDSRHSLMRLLNRIDSGNQEAIVRYPNDTVDRIWYTEIDPLAEFEISKDSSILPTAADGNGAPFAVLRTCRLGDEHGRLSYTFETFTQYSPHQFVVFLYFAELQPVISVGEKTFNIIVNGFSSGPYDIRNLSQGLHQDYMVLCRVPWNSSLTVTLEISRHATYLQPSLNGLEIYELIPSVPSTSESDVQALLVLKEQFNLVQWSGDPCLPTNTTWEGVTCDLKDDIMTVTALELSNHGLSGSIPNSLNNITNLMKLILHNNSLFGNLPDLSSLVALQSLDLRFNQLQGPVPLWLGGLPNLVTLRLDYNEFSGMIPVNLAERNQTFTFTFTGNPLLNSARRGSPLKTFIGAVVGATAFVGIMAMIITTYCYRKKQAKVRPRFPVWTPEKSLGPTYVMKSPQDHNVDLNLSCPQEHSLKEVEIITGKFKSRIGEGGFGAVYYGTLSDGSAVAVKVRSVNSHQGTREFTTELDLLRQVRHENLVPLVGFCAEYQQQILIYPYMSNGSLHDRLYDVGIGRKSLDWQTRLNIVLGAARGLNFLHTGRERCIIHRDVKSSNILLDDSMKAKIADFGLSKYSPVDGDTLVSTEVRGTAGYLDPEYYSTQQLTDKSDVFSFGIVLLEIVCGREPLNMQRPREEWSLLEWVKPFIKDSNIQQIVDPAISQSYTPESLWRVLEVALQSVEGHSSRRPTMAYIVRELEDAVIIENNASQYMASIQSLDSLCIPSYESKDYTSLKAPSAYDLTSPFQETSDSPSQTQEESK